MPLAPFTVAAVDALPIPVPEDVPLHPQPYTLAWNAVEGALWYHVRVERDGAILHSEWMRGSAASNWTADALLPWGTYHWSVDFYKDTESGVASELQAFFLPDFS